MDTRGAETSGPLPPFFAGHTRGDEGSGRLEALLTSALAASDTALWDWRTDEEGLSLSASYYTMLGYGAPRKGDRKGAWIDHIHSRDAQKIRNAFKGVLSRKANRINAEFRARKKSGAYCWFRLRGRTVERAPEGRPLRMVGTIVGLDEEKQWEEALTESRRRHETLLDNLPGMAYRCLFQDGEWTMAFVSDGCLELTGYTPAELTGNRENYAHLIHPEDRGFVWSKVETALMERRAYEIVYRIQTASGEDKWVWERGTGIFSRQGNFQAIEGFTTDITAYQKARQDLQKENTRLKSAMQDQHRLGRLIGKSDAMQTVYDLILQAAASSAGVMIYGESGTGKELVAKAIHELSDRKNGRFISVNCGAIPDNLLESEFFGYRKGAFTGANRDKPGFLDHADGGTLFLDEVGEIHPNLQVKLLRAIEGGGYTPVGGSEVKQPDIRVICATNRDLKEMVWKGRMRKDFFYRVHIIPIQVPPLRERREDIPLLILHFLELFGQGRKDLSTIPGNILRALHEYDWPGNVRELQNLMQRYVTLRTEDFLKTHPFGDMLKRRMPLAGNPDAPRGTQLTRAVQSFEQHHIEQALARHGGNRTRAAKALGIGLRTLQRKIKQYGLH